MLLLEEYFACGEFPSTACASRVMRERPRARTIALAGRFARWHPAVDGYSTSTVTTPRILFRGVAADDSEVWLSPVM
jgi:hypothetical protein